MKPLARGHTAGMKQTQNSNPVKPITFDLVVPNYCNKKGLQFTLIPLSIY